MYIWGRPYMTSDGRGEGGSARSEFISKGALIKHLMRGEGGSKNGKNHLTSYMDGPLYRKMKKCISNSGKKR